MVLTFKIFYNIAFCLKKIFYNRRVCLFLVSIYYIYFQLLITNTKHDTLPTMWLNGRLKFCQYQYFNYYQT